ISANSQLTSLRGLGGLKEVSGTVSITSNSALSTLDGLGSLDVVGGAMSITSNNALVEISGIRANVGSNLTISGSSLLAFEFGELSSLGGALSVSSVP